MNGSKAINNQYVKASTMIQKSQEEWFMKLLVQARYKQNTLEHYNYPIPKDMEVPDIVKSTLPEFTSMAVAYTYIIRFIEMMTIVKKDIDPLLTPSDDTQGDYCNIINLMLAFYIGINLTSFMILQRAYDHLLQQGQKPNVENVLHMLTLSIY